MTRGDGEDPGGTAELPWAEPAGASSASGDAGDPFGTVDDEAVVRRYNPDVAALRAEAHDYRRALQRLSAVSEVTAGIVHDVRNALHVSLFQSSYLEGVLESPELAESARSIHQASVHAERLLCDLLSLARGRNARVSVVDTVEMLARCRRLVEHVARRQVDCAFHADRGVWRVAVEPHQLEAAIINLSANARDAMPDGGHLVVTARNVARGSGELPTSLPDDDYVAFVVQDTGTGMSAEVLARATEPFFTTKAHDHGTGIGLSMVQSFAQRHGGAFLLESALGRGTSARILLPRAADPVTADEQCRPSVQEALARVRARLTTSWMLAVLDAWRGACPYDGFPRPFTLESAIEEVLDVTVVLAVDDTRAPPALHLQRLGDTLARLRQVPVNDPRPVDPSFITVARYQEALRLGVPLYERVQGVVRDGHPVAFERLILPVATDGRRVSHLYGVMAIPAVAREARAPFA